MFSFGRDHDFSPRSSKQLKTISAHAMVDHQPRRWIRGRNRGKMIALDKIASIPMLALVAGNRGLPVGRPTVR
jgi:pyruvate, water dikinase